MKRMDIYTVANRAGHVWIAKDLDHLNKRLRLNRDLTVIDDDLKKIDATAELVKANLDKWGVVRLHAKHTENWIYFINKHQL
jgi:hypothetical protein